MFSGIPAETPLDLRFWLFGTHVRVHPMHWVVSAILGWSWYDEGGPQLLYLPVWLLAVFASVLLHEMGHVLMGRLFGSKGHILLYSFGGLAIGSSDLRKRWQRILVLFAGPVIQLVFLAFIIAGAVVVAPFVPPTWQKPVLIAFEMLFFINLVWPLFNLLPLWPLDGGRITREVLEGLMGHRGVLASLWISIIVSGLMAAGIFLNATHVKVIPYVGWLGDSFYNAMFLAYFCVIGIQTLQAENRRRGRWDDELPWER